MKYGLNSYRGYEKYVRLERCFTKNRKIYGVGVGTTNRRRVEAHYSHLQELSTVRVLMTYTGEAGSRTMVAPRSRNVVTQEFGVVSIERTITITHAELLMIAREVSTVKECMDIIMATLEMLVSSTLV